MADGAENKGGVTGKGWLPGQSGNPGGRPKGIAAQARQHGARALDVLVEALESDDEKVKIAAAREILDRGYGKALTMTADVTSRLDEMDDDALDAALSVVRAAIRAGGEAGERGGSQTAH